MLVGPLIHLEEGERAHIVGTWVNDSRYGPQVKVAEARPLPPSRRCHADRLPAPGQARRQQARRRARGALRRRRGVRRDRPGPSHGLRLGRDPAPPGRPRRPSRWEAAGHAAAAPAAGAPWAGLSGHAESRALRHGRARVVSESPYQLTSVFGVGFLIADRIARRLGDPPRHAPSECARGALHILAEAERAGSTCMPSTPSDGRGTSCWASPGHRASSSTVLRARRRSRCVTECGSTGARRRSSRPSWPNALQRPRADTQAALRDHPRCPARPS